MSSTAMMATSLAFSGLQTMSQNSALRRKQRADDRTTYYQIEELKRQQKRANEIAQEEKSDVAREFDLQLGTLLAAGADGGVTQAALARAGGAAGAIAGLDKARIESNRQEGQGARRYESLALIEENAARRAETKSAIWNNTLSFFGNAVGSVYNMAYNPATVQAPVTTNGASRFNIGNASTFRTNRNRTGPF